MQKKVKWGDEAVEYLNRVLGIHVVYQNDSPKSMPNFIYDRYNVQTVLLNGIPAVFVNPKTRLDTVSSIKKHLDRIERTAGAPAILVPNQLTSRQKEYLLRDHIPFIVDGRQIYLPFMAVYLQERGDGEKQELSRMLPSAQLLLLYIIYHGCNELSSRDAAQQLGFTATSISRASKQLEDMGFVRTEKRGVQKIILADKTPKELFNTAKNSMISPVKRSIYVPKNAVHEKLLISGYSALSEFTMINPPAVECFAADRIACWEGFSSARLHDSNNQCEIELWRYDPKKLATDDSVDRLSLALALSEDQDERVEEAVEEMLDCVWEDIHGQRN